MKRMIAALLLIIMCLSLCACGAPRTFEAAVEKAESKISKWDSQNYNGYGYTSTYPENGKSFSVLMIPTLDNPGMYTEFVAKAAAKEVYKDISKCFSALDTKIIIAIGNSSKIMYMFTEDDFK